MFARSQHPYVATMHKSFKSIEDASHATVRVPKASIMANFHKDMEGNPKPLFIVRIILLQLYWAHLHICYFAQDQGKHIATGKDSVTSISHLNLNKHPESEKNFMESEQKVAFKPKQVIPTPKAARSSKIEKALLHQAIDEVMKGSETGPESKLDYTTQTMKDFQVQYEPKPKEEVTVPYYKDPAITFYGNAADKQKDATLKNVSVYMSKQTAPHQFAKNATFSTPIYNYKRGAEKE